MIPAADDDGSDINLIWNPIHRNKTFVNMYLGKKEKENGKGGMGSLLPKATKERNLRTKEKIAVEK